METEFPVTVEKAQPDDDEDWAEFATHDADQNEFSSVEASSTWDQQFRACFPLEPSPPREHIKIPLQSAIQEKFMELVMKKNHARVASLPGRSSLWLGTLPVDNILLPRATNASNGHVSSHIMPAAEKAPCVHLMVVDEASFELDLPVPTSSAMSTPPIVVNDKGDKSSREFPFGLAHLPVHHSENQRSRHSRTKSDSGNVLGHTRSWARHHTDMPEPHRRSSASLGHIQASPEPELGFNEDVAALGLTRLPQESLLEMCEEMRAKAQRLSDDLVSSLEIRDRLLRTTTIKNKFVASLLDLQNKLHGQKSRKNTDSRMSVKRKEPAHNKYLTTKLSYKGDAMALEPRTLERLTDVMTAMAEGSSDVSLLMSRYLAIDVFHTDTDDMASPPESPYRASSALFFNPPVATSRLVENPASGCDPTTEVAGGP